MWLRIGSFVDGRADVLYGMNRPPTLLVSTPLNFSSHGEVVNHLSSRMDIRHKKIIQHSILISFNRAPCLHRARGQGRLSLPVRSFFPFPESPAS